MIGGLLPDVVLKDCVWDFFFDLTENANVFVRENATFRHLFMIGSGLMIDILMVS